MPIPIRAAVPASTYTRRAAGPSARQRPAPHDGPPKREAADQPREIEDKRADLRHHQGVHDRWQVGEKHDDGEPDDCGEGVRHLREDRAQSGPARRFPAVGKPEQQQRRQRQAETDELHGVNAREVAGPECADRPVEQQPHPCDPRRGRRRAPLAQLASVGIGGGRYGPIGAPVGHGDQRNQQPHAQVGTPLPGPRHSLRRTPPLHQSAPPRALGRGRSRRASAGRAANLPAGCRRDRKRAPSRRSPRSPELRARPRSRRRGASRTRWRAF